MSKTILVIGATGAMGRPVVAKVLSDMPEARVRILTRDPSGEFALALVREGAGRVEAVKGDTSNRASLDAAMRGVWGVFCNTDFWSSLNVETEYQQGVNALQAAEAAGVAMFVYSSLDACAKLSEGRLPVPHYDAKAAVEAVIDRRRASEFFAKTKGFYSSRVGVLVTGPYYENLQNFFLPTPSKTADGGEALTFSMAMEDKPFPMVALDDIAHFAVMMLKEPQTWGGRTLPILSETISYTQLVETFTHVTGIPATYTPLPLQAIRDGSPVGHDIANSMQFYQEIGCPRDFAELRRLHPGLLTFEAWLRKTNWRGEFRTVQKGAATGEPR